MKNITLQQITENKIKLSDVVNMGILHKGEVFTYFDEGCTRFVFKNKDSSKVIKLLKDKVGKDYNKEELEIYNSASVSDKSMMAETNIHNGYIEQEFVTPMKFAGKKLTMEEIRFASSCRNEVGWNSKGNLVCFDLDEYKKY